MNNIGVMWVFILMFLICSDILGRTFFGSPIQAIPEIVSLSLVGCVFLQLSSAVENKKLTKADVGINLIKKKKPDFAKFLNLISSIIGFLVLFFLSIGVYPDLIRSIQTQEFSGVEGIYTIPLWPIKFTVLLGSVISAISFLKNIVLLGRSYLSYFSLVFLMSLLFVFFCLLMNPISLSDRAIGIFSIISVLILICIGTPISISLFSIGFIGIAALKQDFQIGINSLSLIAQGTISEYVFATIPLFVLMGLFVSASEIGKDSFNLAHKVFGRIKGGLGVATVAANAIFAAITGISIASAAIFSKIAVPEMIKNGYTGKFSAGLTAGSSVLGMLIPPSLLLIIYGVIAEVSIGSLFLAAIVPGLILAISFSIGVIIMSNIWPEFVGNLDNEEDCKPISFSEVISSFLPLLILILLVLGGIYGGIFTPTEAGAAGSLAAMILSLIKKKLNMSKLWDVIQETGQITVTILFLIISASTFSRMLTLSGLPADMGMYMNNLGLGMAGFLFCYLLLLILLGTVLDSTSILLILLPLVLPVVADLGGNFIWFGIITVIGVEIGLMTPPLGLSVYVIKSSLEKEKISLGEIFIGAAPFALITLLVTIILMVFPQISLSIL
ncbi:MAG: TRAP transporter large permease subunit [Pseudomonadota bacterium]|nr:TRAP transporter large permease subunit [Pseudomonadota bacterium]